MSASHRSRGVPPWITGLLVLSVVGALAASCVASSPSVSPSPPFSPVIEPNPSPPFSPVVDPNQSPPPSGSNTPWRPAGMSTLPADSEDLGQRETVLAGDGRVLVVGPQTAELWDPATSEWRATTPLNKPRYEFAAVALADGRVLVAGGVNEEMRGGGEAAQSFSSSYVYDPRPGHEDWTKVGLLGTARTAPSIARLPGGRVLVAGGYFYTGPAYGRADERDVTLAAYRPGADGSSPLIGPLYDVDVPPWGYALATAELFDPTTGTWSTTGSMRYARAGAPAVTLADGRILVVGSSDANVTGVHPDAYGSAEVYDPATGRFSPAGQLPEIDTVAIEELGVVLPSDGGAPGAVGTMVALSDGGALLVGSTRWWKHTADVTRTIRFDVRSGSWSEVGQPCASAWDDSHQNLAVTPGVCRLDAMVAQLPDGRVLIAGGTSRYMYVSPVMTSAELYDPTTDAWTPITSMPEGRAASGTAVLNDGSVLVVGGRDSEYAQLRSAVRLVPPR